MKKKLNKKLLDYCRDTLGDYHIKYFNKEYIYYISENNYYKTLSFYVLCGNRRMTFAYININNKRLSINEQCSVYPLNLYLLSRIFI